MLERGTLHIPTLALLASLIGAKAIAVYKQPPTGMLVGWLKLQRTSREANATAVRTLAAAGVNMVTGTDGGNPAVFHGYSVHRELRLLVEAGLSPRDGLVATTINAARLLGRKWGMEIGDEGTLVILDGSPLVDIRNTEWIHAVFSGA